MTRNADISKLKEFLVYSGILAILYLFYKSVWIIIPYLPCLFIARKVLISQREQKRKKELNIQFKDMLISMSASLRAGYSVENAIITCRREMAIMHGDTSAICMELSVMINQLGVGMNAEDVFLECALRNGIEDIDTFSSVFSIAKRTGGNMAEIMGKTAEDIGGRIDTMKEIDVLVSAKRMEQHIMTLLPALTIFYIDMTSGGLLDPLYGNAAGISVMSICLALYAFAAVLAGRIMNIEV